MGQSYATETEQGDVQDLQAFSSSISQEWGSSSKNLGIITIVDQNLYKGDNNYLFALTQKEASVMSLYRFYQLEIDTLSDGLPRAVVSSITSYIPLLGLKRAPSLPCVTAYPHSLEEFDQKDDFLCPETLNQLIESYNRS